MTLRATRTSTKHWPATGILLALTAATLAGCAPARVQYGREDVTFAPKNGPRSIAVAPCVNLSGQRGPDPLLQADIVYQELQQVHGLTVVPVNRTVQAMAGLDMPSIESVDQARAICAALGVDAILVPTISAYDPYDPPKFGASVQIFRAGGEGPGNIDVRALARQSTGNRVESMPANADFVQAVHMFDAAAGSTREQVEDYAAGRVDPTMPLGVREFYLDMDRYAAFAWHELIGEAFDKFRD